MKNTLLLIVIALFVYSCNTAQEIKCDKSFLIVNYNVENLFDTINDPDKYDEAFTPEGKKNWTSKRYNDKLQKLAYVIQQIDEEKMPDVVGLVEIENQTVLEDLISQKELSKANYSIVHHEGPDARGIDCALLYNPKSFKLIESRFFQVKIEGDNRFKTREIVYVKGLTKSKDTLHIFVNHWPSRRGGQEKSEHKRVRAAEVLRLAVDSIQKSNSNSKIIIVGDFNDETTDKSIKKQLRAKNDFPLVNMDLVNLSANADAKGIGTYHYWKTNEWNMLDQMIITSNLLIDFKGGLMVESNEMQIFSPDWIMHTNKDGSKTPAKTYGKGYYGGYSDHLPVYMYLGWKCKLKKN